MERLHMHEIQDIVYRLRQGQSERGIARDLGISRITVHRYAEFARQQGYLAIEAALPEVGPVVQALGPTPKPPHMTSTVEPYRTVVEEWVQKGVEQMAIYQRLIRGHGYTGSYSSVRRFVGQLLPAVTGGVVRVETGPGQEAQVDFGSVGKLLDPTSGKERVAYVFVMTLSYSRHCYVEFVFDQTMATWVGCHRRAFASFGGVVAEVVVDNLKAAILKHGIEDPVLCVPYRRMAQHYGFLIHACRPRTPQHKGKVESGVHYVKRNLMAGARFQDVRDANRQGQEWVTQVAGVRRHGTTQEAPLKRFADFEAGALKPLPSEPFELVRTHRVKLHRDCHVVVSGRFYSAPYRYVGQELEAHVYEQTVQLYHGCELLTTHLRAKQPGERVTRVEHYPSDKAHYQRRTPAVCLEEATAVGPGCLELIDALLKERPADHRRAAQRVLMLLEQVGAERLEAACARALSYGDPRYRRVKAILDAGMEQEGPTVQAGPGGTGIEETAGPRVPARQYAHARRSEEFFGPGAGSAARTQEGEHASASPVA